MPKAKNAKADEALELFRQGIKLVEIAGRLGVPPGTVRRWKSIYGWESERSEKIPSVRKRGAQPGNKNSKGGPPGNKKAEKYGFLSKYLPSETKEIFDAVAEADPLDLLWHQIQIQYAAIIRAQKIAYVKDQHDKTIERVEEKDGNVIGERWEVQQAWDKQENFLKAQSRAMSTLANMLRHYEQMLRDRGENVTEEQRLRLEKLRAETERIRRSSDPDQDDGVEIINDAPRQENGQDLGHCDSEVPADI